jgi:hypothetical protein
MAIKDTFFNSRNKTKIEKMNSLACWKTCKLLENTNRN